MLSLTVVPAPSGVEYLANKWQPLGSVRKRERGNGEGGGAGTVGCLIEEVSVGWMVGWLVDVAGGCLVSFGEVSCVSSWRCGGLVE